MKKFLAGFVGSLLLCGATPVALPAAPAADSSHAQVTFTVTKFRALDQAGGQHYTDATMALALHAAVKIGEHDGQPTLFVNRAVDLEITVVSADPAESYRAVAVTFQQYAAEDGSRNDAAGAINFGQWQTENGTVVMRHKFTQKTADSRYEFFVLIQRTSDGAIGLIDPDIENQPGQ